jgi:mannose-6-phosphate isomerase-like protein (cupin superfamily)
MSRGPKPPGTPAEFLTRERCYIAEILNDPAEPQVSVARARVEPGVTTERHTLSVLEWYVIETGRGRIQLGDSQPYDVFAGDTIRIPAFCEQKIANTGDSDLLFLCVCVPRFDESCYQSAE